MNHMPLWFLDPNVMGNKESNWYMWPIWQVISTLVKHTYSYSS